MTHTVGVGSAVVWHGLTSHSTHFRSFLRGSGDCGISQDYSAEASSTAQPHSVCGVESCVARPLLITVACIRVLFERRRKLVTNDYTPTATV